jgi:hypothetical protein
VRVPALDVRLLSQQSEPRRTIKEAIVDVSGEHFVDLELEALAMMKRE